MQVREGLAGFGYNNTHPPTLPDHDFGYPFLLAVSKVECTSSRRTVMIGIAKRTVQVAEVEANLIPGKSAASSIGPRGVAPMCIIL